MLPAHRFPAVEIVRAGEGERNAEAGGEEEELLHHFSQPWAFLGLQGARSGGQEWLPPYTASSPILAPKSGVLERRTGTLG